MPIAVRPTGDANADLFQRDVVQLLNMLERLAILKTYTVKALDLGIVAKRVRHGLKNKPAGFFAVWKDSAVEVCEAGPDLEPQTFIQLVAGGAVTVDLVFY